MSLSDAPSSARKMEIGWPLSPPVFQSLTTTDDLRVPLCAHPSPIAPAPLSGELNTGDPLLDNPAEASHMAVAPAGATVDQVGTVSLLDGREVPAVRLLVKTMAEPAAADLMSAVRFTEAVLRDIQPRDLGVWIDHIRDAGIWADRWTSPDLLGQLNAILRRPIDSVVLNLLDVDPTVAINAALAANYSDELLAGIGLLSKITGASTTLAVIDPQTPPAWLARLRVWCRGERAGAIPGLKFVALPNVYPQSDPSLLLYALMNKRLRPGRLPTDLGVLVLDVAAAVAVGQRLLHHKPMLTVPLAIRDHTRKESHFCNALVGTQLSHVLRRIGLPPASQLVLRGGDVLRDIQIGGDAVVGGTELIIHANGHEPPINPEPCVRCGWCFESCPTRVQPANCLEAAQRNDTELATRFGIDGCIDCGICSYVCPSHLPILAGIRQLRKSMG